MAHFGALEKLQRDAAVGAVLRHGPGRLLNAWRAPERGQPPRHRSDRASGFRVYEGVLKP